jgi:hypothetical protein
MMTTIGSPSLFDANTCERVRYYVYALFDSECDCMPFYIGKGCGNRVFDHVNERVSEWDEKDDTQLLSAKLTTIASIKEAGRRVVHRIIRYGMCEEEALHVEAALIDTVNLMHPGLLVNEILGHGVAQGIFDTDDLRTMLNAQP